MAAFHCSDVSRIHTYTARDRLWNTRALNPDANNKNDVGSGTGAGPPESAVNRYSALRKSHTRGFTSFPGPPDRVTVAIPEPVSVLPRPSPGIGGGRRRPDAVKGTLKLRISPMTRGTGRRIGPP